MQPLVDDMVQDEPGKRPTVDAVVSRFDEIRVSLQARKLHSRLVANDENRVERVVKSMKYALVRKVSHPLPGLHGGKEHHSHPQ